MHIGKIGQFLEVWVFPATNAGLCVDGPHKTAGDLQNTPGTPAMHFPLVVAGSQSALYLVTTRMAMAYIVMAICAMYTYALYGDALYSDALSSYGP